MKIEKWDIVPYIRAGSIAFNINKNEARSILGKEYLAYFDKDENKTILYWQEAALQLVFDDQGLSMVSFYPNIENIFIGEVILDWNDTMPVFKWLLDNDSSAMTDVGIFVFFKYGISVLGFESEETSEKSVTAFRNGIWSREDALLRPIDRNKILATWQH